MTEAAPKPQSKLALKLLAMQRAADEAFKGVARDQTTVSIPAPVPIEAASIPSPKVPRAVLLRVADIEVRTQARRRFDGLDALAENIAAYGQHQAIVVQELAPDHYLLQLGERRLRAVRDFLKRDTILAFVIDEEHDATYWELAQLSENIHRKDYEPLELARAFGALLTQNQWSIGTLADNLRLSKSWVSKRVSLLDAPVQVQEAIASGELSETDYYNHRQRYDQALRDEPVDSSPAGLSRTAMVNIPLATAVHMAKLMEIFAALAQLTPVDLSARPTKKELLALFESRVVELHDHFTVTDGQASTS